jgi:hypothetical protein
MADTKSTVAQEPQLTVERSSDYRMYYANNIQFESTAWDVKFTFGHLDVVSAPAHIKNECSITIPWQQAKLALFWLRLHVEVAEAEIRAKIPLRKDLLPQQLPGELPISTTDTLSADRFREIYERLREEFLKTV